VVRSHLIHQSVVGSLPPQHKEPLRLIVAQSLRRKPV
jgi:PIN domain nuclease of toxin-antitoxin system